VLLAALVHRSHKVMISGEVFSLYFLLFTASLYAPSCTLLLIRLPPDHPFVWQVNVFR